MKKQNPLYTLQLPPITEAFAKTLDAAFPVNPVTPTTTIEQIMFNAGQRQVVEYVKRAAINKTDVLGRSL